MTKIHPDMPRGRWRKTRTPAGQCVFQRLLGDKAPSHSSNRRAANGSTSRRRGSMRRESAIGGRPCFTPHLAAPRAALQVNERPTDRRAWQGAWLARHAANPSLLLCHQATPAESARFPTRTCQRTHEMAAIEDAGTLASHPPPLWRRCVCDSSSGRGQNIS